MRICRTFHTIDTHTQGEPTRNVVGGIPAIPGATMKDKMVYMMENGDWIRRLLCNEPRGNDVMSGTIVTSPCRPEADVGVLYFEVGGWMPMCGHDTIGVATALVESGMVKITEPVTHITLDTPAGLIRLEVQVDGAAALSVSFINAPAFVMARDAPVHSGTFGDLRLDIAYGGNIYAILPAASVGLAVSPEHASRLIAAGSALGEDINAQLQVQHPELPFENHVTHVEFYEPAAGESGGVRNAVIIPPGAIDRSPCGTGTAAKCAVLAAKGLLKKGESFPHESIIGSRFTCLYLDDAQVCGIPAVVSRVTGRAWVTGIHTFLLAPDDPFPEGFCLR